MNSSDAENLARRFIQAWNAGHLHVVDELAAGNLTVSYTHFPESFQGPGEFKEMLVQTHRCFPDLTIQIDEVVADEDQAVVHWRYRGTFQEGEMFGVEAAGQSVEVAGMTRYHVADGEVQREQGIVDNFGLMMQLGAMPAPKSKAQHHTVATERLKPVTTGGASAVERIAFRCPSRVSYAVMPHDSTQMTVRARKIILLLLVVGMVKGPVEAQPSVSIDSLRHLAIAVQTSPSNGSTSTPDSILGWTVAAEPDAMDRLFSRLVIDRCL